MSDAGEPERKLVFLSRWSHPLGGSANQRSEARVLVLCGAVDDDAARAEALLAERLVHLAVWIGKDGGWAWFAESKAGNTNSSVFRTAGLATQENARREAEHWARTALDLSYKND